MDKQKVNVESLYGVRSDSPLVRLTIDGHETLMDPAKAVTIAEALMEAAEASYSDAFIVRFVEHKIGVEREQAVMILREFRQWRELHRRADQEREEADQAELNK